VTVATIPLVHLAHARSGDKGDTANVGVIAYDAAHYPMLREALTPEAVKAWFGPLVHGSVERFELPNLHALNFLLHGALDGGGTRSLMNDAQGKVFSTAILRMPVEVPDAVAAEVAGRGRIPQGWSADDYGRGGPA
jgi:hypothetical protein